MYLKNKPNLSALNELKNPFEFAVMSGFNCKCTVNKIDRIIPDAVIKGITFLFLKNKSTTITIAAKQTTVISGDSK
jgi:hypothetical protein